MKNLPTGYEYYLVEESKAHVTYQVNVTTVEDAETFLQEMKRSGKMEWRIQQRRKSNSALAFGVSRR